MVIVSKKLKIRYFPLRAFLSHTRFHCRHCLLFILQTGIIIHSTQRYGTETVSEETAQNTESQNQALSACNFFFGRPTFFFSAHRS
jgi:hypothetical protein